MADKSKSYGDKDIATNLLVTLKHMKAELNTFTQEESNDELFTKIDEVYTCVSKAVNIGRNNFLHGNLFLLFIYACYLKRYEFP